MAQERAQAEAWQKQQAWQGINQWLESLPAPEKERQAILIQKQLNDAQSQRLDQDNEELAKQRALDIIATRSELVGEYRAEFYDLANAMTDPLAVERLAARQRRTQDMSENRRPRPGMASVRPDAGAPNGSSGGGRRAYEDLIRPFMPGGPKQGHVQEMEELLIQNGYR